MAKLSYYHEELGCHNLVVYACLSAVLVEFSPVATYPSAGGRRETHGCIFQERKMQGVATNVYLRKTSKKTGKDVVYEI